MSFGARATRASYLLLAALAFASYARVLGADFAVDDAPDIVRNAAMLPPSGWGRFLTDASSQSADPLIAHHKWRPLASLSYALNVWSGGYNPFWFHLADVLLHAAATCLVFALAARLLGYGWPALAAAVLFCLHPAQVESVANATMRAGSLSALFCLAVLLLDDPARTTPPRRAAALVAFACGLLAKEEAAFLPFALAALDRVRGPARWGWRDVARRGAPYWLILAAYVAARYAVIGTLAHRGPWGGRWLLQAAYAAQGLLGDFRRLTLTMPASICYSVREGPGFLATSAAAGAALAVAAAATLVGLRRRRRWAFGAALLLAGLLPVAGLLPIETITADRFLYVPLMGAGLLLGELVARGDDLAGLAAVIALALAFLPSNLARQLDWDDDTTLNFAAMADRPSDPCGKLRVARQDADWGMSERARRLTVPALGPGERMTRLPGLRLAAYIEWKADRCRDATAYARQALRLDRGDRQSAWVLARCRRPP